jgi:hypothetical protein
MIGFMGYMIRTYYFHYLDKKVNTEGNELERITVKLIAITSDYRLTNVL